MKTAFVTKQYVSGLGDRWVVVISDSQLVNLRAGAVHTVVGSFLTRVKSQGNHRTGFTCLDSVHDWAREVAYGEKCNVIVWDNSCILSQRFRGGKAKWRRIQLRAQGYIINEDERCRY